MNKKFKNMQDRKAADLVCSKCGQIILPASRTEVYRERDIQEAKEIHKCKGSA